MASPGIGPDAGLTASAKTHMYARHHRPHRPHRHLALLLVGIVCASPGVALGSDVPADAHCAIGSYRLDDGSTLDLGPGAAGQLRWRRADGTTGALTRHGQGRWISTRGWTRVQDGHQLDSLYCGTASLRFDGVDGRRIPLLMHDTRFQSGDTTLAGRLTLPPGSDTVPIVVLVHGAERDAALQRYSLQRELASAGIGVFAYDKRGTGMSGGRYTQNYLTLAIDAVHAMREARRLAGPRAGRTGYQGGSQGGWVAPLAATIEPVDFIVVSFGLAVSALDEDREAIVFDMQRAGHNANATAQAMEIADATATLVESGFSDGYAQLDEVRRRYGAQAWFGDVRGNVSGYLLTTPADTIRRDGPQLLEGLIPRYDPMPVLENLAIPQLWLLGGQDRDAPPFETLRRLSALQAAGKPITTAVFADADHGMYEFVIDADGERVSTRQPDGYLRRMRDFILARPDAAHDGITTPIAPPKNADPPAGRMPPCTSRKHRSVGRRPCGKQGMRLSNTTAMQELTLS